MSLVNDVLRQLDDRQTAPARTIPLQPLQAQPSERGKAGLQKVLLGIGLLLGLTLMIQLVFQQPLKHVLFTSDMTKELAIAKPEINEAKLLGNLNLLEPIVLTDVLEEPDTVNPKISITERVISKSDLSKSVTPKLDISQPVEVNVVEQEAIFIGEVKAKKISEKHNVKPALSRKESSFEKPNGFETKIDKVEIAGYKHYRMAIKAYKKKQNIIAMKWINQAIEESSDEKYSVLKARILIQQKLGDELNQYVLSQSENSSLDWFRLVAPGLQMFGFYQLSNQYYLPLVAQQPNQVKWQLAMALNYSRLNLEDESYSIYKTLAASTVLSRQQRKWVLAKLNRMDSNKVAVNGS